MSFGAIGGAVLGGVASSVVGGVMGGGGGGQQSGTQAVMPQWLLGDYKNLNQRAIDLSEEDYVSYQGNRQAGFNQDERDAWALGRGTIGTGGLGESQDMTREVGRRGLEGFSQEELQPWMNPYIENVVDVGRRKQFEDFDRLQNDYRNRAGEAAAFGGSRFGIGEAEMNRGFREDLADFETESLFSGYNDGMNRAMQGTQMAGQSAMNMANLNQAQRQMDLTDVDTLNTIGGIQRQHQQTGLDLKYQDFLDEQAHPYDQVQFLQSVMQPMAQTMRGSQVQQTQQQGGSGILGNVLGGASIGRGLFSGGGGNNGGTYGGVAPSAQGFQYQQNQNAGSGLYGPGFNKGGEVKGYSRGGTVESNSRRQTATEDNEYDVISNLLSGVGLGGAAQGKGSNKYSLINQLLDGTGLGGNRPQGALEMLSGMGGSGGMGALSMMGGSGMGGLGSLMGFNEGGAVGGLDRFMNGLVDTYEQSLMQGEAGDDILQGQGGNPYAGTEMEALLGSGLPSDGIDPRMQEIIDMARSRREQASGIENFSRGQNQPSRVEPQGDYFDVLAQLESSGNPSAINKDTGAAGLFQFMPKTAKAYGLQDAHDPTQALEAVGRFTEDNAKVLRKKLKREPSDGELYLAHQQGATGASKLLANPNKLAVDVVGKRAVTLNGGSEDMTAGEFASLWTSKFESKQGYNEGGMVQGYEGGGLVGYLSDHRDRMVQDWKDARDYPMKESPLGGSPLEKAGTMLQNIPIGLGNLVGKAAMAPSELTGMLTTPVYNDNDVLNNPNTVASANTPAKMKALHAQQQKMMREAMANNAAKAVPAPQQQQQKAPSDKIAKIVETLQHPLSPKKEQGSTEKKKKEPNYALINFGATLLGSDKDFSHAFGDATKSYTTTKMGQKERDMKALQDQANMALKERAIAVQEGQLQQSNNTYAKALKRLKIEELMQKVDGKKDRANLQQKLFDTLMDGVINPTPDQSNQIWQQAGQLAGAAGGDSTGVPTGGGAQKAADYFNKE